MTSLPLAIVHEPSGLAGTRLQREPYRLFFPLGIVLGWAAVGHWILYALGLITGYHPVFHAMGQIQGFLLCFAIGFLFTMIPRRTQSPPPTHPQLAIGVIGPITTTLAAWFELWAWAQAAWLVVASMMVGFLLARIRASRAKRRPPNSFVWLPLGLAMGMGGAVLAGVGAGLGAHHWWLHQLGQTLVLQGMFLALVVGVGGLAIPLMTRGEAPPDGQTTAADMRERLAHVTAAVALLATFVVEARGAAATAYIARGLLVLLSLVVGAHIHRPPTRPGLNRWLIWSAAWALPAGYLLAGLASDHAKAALHVSFIGGLALLSLAVSTQVTIGHGGHDRLLAGRPWQVLAIAVLLTIATLARLLLSLDPARYLAWLGIAAGAFVLAGAVWMLFLLPKLVVRS